MITMSMFYGCLGPPEFFNFLKFLGQKEQIILECVLCQNNKTFLLDAKNVACWTWMGRWKVAQRDGHGRAATWFSTSAL